MTTVVLLVLAIVWGVLLVSWLRSRTEGTFYDSVGTFRRHLTVLERAAPSSVLPANRLRNGSVAGRSLPATRSSLVRTGYAGRPRAGSPGSSLRPHTPAALRRRQAQKRRRDVFFVLLAGAVGSFLLAMIPGMSIVWSVQVMFDLALGGYVALLIRIRNLAAERELKLTFMPQQSRVARPRPAYDLGRGGNYAELGLRRAAN